MSDEANPAASPAIDGAGYPWAYGQSLNADDLNATFSGNPGLSPPDRIAAWKRWIDTGRSGYALERYWDGQAAVYSGAFDPANHLWLPLLGGGIASVTTDGSGLADLGAVPENLIELAGAEFAAIGTSLQVGAFKLLRFTGATNLVASSLLVLVGAPTSGVSAAGDMAIAVALGSGTAALVYMVGARGDPIADAPADGLIYGRSQTGWQRAPGWVNTVADLATLGVPSGPAQPLMVWGYRQPGDDGGDPFQWSPSSTAAVDNGLVFAGPGGSGVAGRWLRLVNRSPSFAMWGAWGDSDGINGHGHDDAAAIEAAIASGVNRLGSSPGKRYRIATETVVTPADGLELELAFFYDIPNTGTHYALILQGAPSGADLAVNGHSAAGSWSVQLASTAGLAPGTWCKLWSNRLFDQNRTSTWLGEMIRLATPDAINPGGFVYFETQLRDSYGGRLASASVAAGGSGYVLGDLPVIQGGTGTLQQLRVVGVGAGGTVTAVEWNDEEAVNTTPAGTQATAGGSGTGLTVSVTREQAWLTPIAMPQDLRARIDVLSNPAQFFTGDSYYSQVAFALRYCYGSHVEIHSCGINASALEFGHAVLCTADVHFTDQAELATTGYGLAINGACRQCSGRIWAGHRNRHFAETGNYGAAGDNWGPGICRDNVFELVSATSSARAGGDPSYPAPVLSVDTAFGGLTCSNLSSIHHLAPVQLRRASGGSLPTPFQLGFTYYGYVIGSQIWLYTTYNGAAGPGGPPPPGFVLPTSAGSGGITVMATPGGAAFKTHAAAEGTVIRFGRLTGITGSAVVIESPSAVIEGGSILNNFGGAIVCQTYASRRGRYVVRVGSIDSPGWEAVRIQSINQEVAQASVKAVIRRAGGVGVYLIGSLAAPLRRLDVDLNIHDTQPSASGGVTEAYFGFVQQLSGRISYDCTAVGSAVDGVQLRDCINFGALRINGAHADGAAGVGIFIDCQVPTNVNGAISGALINCLGNGAALRGLYATANVSNLLVGTDNDFSRCGTPVTLLGGRPRNNLRQQMRVSPSSGATVVMSAAFPDLLILPSGPLAALTVTLPPLMAHYQVVRIATSYPITALTLNTSDGSSVFHLPASLADGQAFSAGFRLEGPTWYPTM